ncbi:hypothetical protein F5144DRAFT_317722 [Chaetomium tenue]|uniref:Uncharacterized protein n=1 Tax=Chaetomium tenue TaxID=1854479 RepID=A0ACB7P3I6_9PEZI|nr:hypothetical protein F5144DRAFT_317722 [Chaetomium globosum]
MAMAQSLHCHPDNHRSFALSRLATLGRQVVGLQGAGILPSAAHPVSASLRFSNSLPSFLAVTQPFSNHLLAPTTSSTSIGRGNTNTPPTLTWEPGNKHNDCRRTPMALLPAHFPAESNLAIQPKIGSQIPGPFSHVPAFFFGFFSITEGMDIRFGEPLYYHNGLLVAGAAAAAATAAKLQDGWLHFRQYQVPYSLPIHISPQEIGAYGIRARAARFSSLDRRTRRFGDLVVGPLAVWSRYSCSPHWTRGIGRLRHGHMVLFGTVSVTGYPDSMMHMDSRWRRQLVEASPRSKQTYTNRSENAAQSNLSSYRMQDARSVRSWIQSDHMLSLQSINLGSEHSIGMRLFPGHDPVPTTFAHLDGTLVQNSTVNAPASHTAT